ncbi:extracellular solute-binding protein [Massilia yuzhufengensis]|uniref:Carbohydrate ABC transporter substrate-binding protein, CUT1 family n=1 Tax=Massilia yuzhufengensis TaxID=1164594 RepID=A0A1I1UKT2_9BURK|nr:extracellular solute-binding protein [Massilia yuzhufengensis]SFD71436.1 carbohydrate ABC transporter substrate-binding protein, CUT1 family [Massilia yuzhufengensis]
MTPIAMRLSGTVLAALLCAPAVARAQVEVRMWTLLSGGDGARMSALVERFNASQREVRVVSTTLKWGEPFYTKLITSSVVGAGPDLATVHLSRMTNLAGGGVLRPIQPAELRDAGLNPADFYPRQWQKSQHAGRTYAVPLDLHPLVLYYNKTLVGQAGLLDETRSLKPIEGIDALTDAFRAVRQTTGRPGMTMESAQSSYAIWRLWISMLAQRNAPLIQDGRFAYGQAGVDSLARISQWFVKGYAQPGLDYPASTSQFMGGNAGFMINGVWEVPEMVRATRQGTLGFEYGIVPLPRMYGNDSVWADSHAFAIPANEARPMSPHKARAVMRFVSFVSKHSFGWAEGGHVLAYRPVAESPAVQALMPNRLYAQVPRNVIYDPDAWYMGAAGPLEAMASKFLPAALSSQLTPAQALRMFETEAARMVKKRAPRY